MDIRSIRPLYGAQVYAAAAKPGKKPTSDTPSAAKQEQVEISDASINMQKMRDAVGAAPDIRIELVEQIKAKIKFNAYPIETNLYKAVEIMVGNDIL